MTLVPALKDLIYLVVVTGFATKIVRDLPSIYKRWIKIYLDVRQSFREHERRESVHQFFMEAMEKKLIDNKELQQVSTNLGSAAQVILL